MKIQLKIRQIISSVLAVVFLLSGGVSKEDTVRAEQLSEEAMQIQDSTAVQETLSHEETDNGSTSEELEETEHAENVSVSESIQKTETAEDPDDVSVSESTEKIEISEDPDDVLVSESTEKTETSEDPDDVSMLETADMIESAEKPDSVSASEGMEGTECSEDFPVPDEPPAFHVRIENWYSGYTLIGTFTDFTPDMIRIDTLYSLDGKSWRAITGGDWNLYGLDEEQGASPDQPCCYNAYEPLKSYTTGDIDRFYLKLCITKRNGLTYESQTAVIERGGIQPIPEGTMRYACFPSSMIVRESVSAPPYNFRMYGRYQLTVSEDAIAEEISALLPDTLPVEVQLIRGRDFKVNGVVDCPVTWKPLSLPQLLAGETITIPDVAEPIVVPAGTLLSTSLGSFELEEPLAIDEPPITDEVRLVLNVSPSDKSLAGVLKQTPDGLSIALHQKPTGAVSIEAYVMTEGESGWTELLGFSLLKEMNDQYSTENSGFALVLYNDQEPYKSYLESKEAGVEPTSFFVGFKIEGGIYDGRQLILAWPDIYEELPDLPEVGRSEGNEGNAGATNKGDSTESGQRPDLPQPPEDEEKEPSGDSHEKPSQPDDNSEEVSAPDPDSNREEGGAQDSDDARQEPSMPDPDNNNHEEDTQQEVSAPDPDSNHEEAIVSNPNDTQKESSALSSEAGGPKQSSASSDISEPQDDSTGSGQRPYLPQMLADAKEQQAMSDADDQRPQDFTDIVEAVPTTLEKSDFRNQESKEEAVSVISEGQSTISTEELFSDYQVDSDSASKDVDFQSQQLEATDKSIALSERGTVVEYSEKDNRYMLLFLITALVVVVSGMIAAYHLFCRIARKIKKE